MRAQPLQFPCRKEINSGFAFFYSAGEFLGIFALCCFRRLRRFFSSNLRCFAAYGIFVFLRGGFVLRASFKSSVRRFSAALRFALWVRCF